ncbi:MAG: phosphotyrosine protein phosphatase [Lachnospiraceae bacterium]|nr:phosphotyrosine protein phosphatase [Lachnospiraceae bacterium]
MKKYDRLVFVTKGDTAAGPMAEAILQSKYLLDALDVTSKGLIVLFPEPINPKAEAVLVSNGLSMKGHMSDPLEPEDFNERTLLLTMNDEIRRKVLETFQPEHEELVQVLYQFVGEPEEPRNPYGGTLADYGQCFSELESLIKKLVVQLNEEELLC